MVTWGPLLLRSSTTFYQNASCAATDVNHLTSTPSTSVSTSDSRLPTSDFDFDVKQLDFLTPSSTTSTSTSTSLRVRPRLRRPRLRRPPQPRLPPRLPPQLRPPRRDVDFDLELLDFDDFDHLLRHLACGLVSHASRSSHPWKQSRISCARRNIRRGRCCWCHRDCRLMLAGETPACRGFSEFRTVGPE